MHSTLAPFCFWAQCVRIIYKYLSELRRLCRIFTKIWGIMCALVVMWRGVALCPPLKALWSRVLCSWTTPHSQHKTQNFSTYRYAVPVAFHSKLVLTYEKYNLLWLSWHPWKSALPRGWAILAGIPRRLPRNLVFTAQPSPTLLRWWKSIPIPTRSSQVPAIHAS